MEREVTRDTLAIRFAEIKTDWLQNRSVQSRMEMKTVSESLDLFGSLRKIKIGY